MATSIPVPFADLGKSTNDLLGKDFPVGQTKFELKTVAPGGVVRIKTSILSSEWRCPQKADPVANACNEMNISSMEIMTNLTILNIHCTE